MVRGKEKGFLGERYILLKWGRKTSSQKEVIDSLELHSANVKKCLTFKKYHAIL